MLALIESGVPTRTMPVTYPRTVSFRSTTAPMVRLAAHAVAAPSSMRSPARRDDDDSLPPCWPPTITSAAPRLATAKPNSLRDVSRSWISVAKSAVASGIVVGMISALSEAGVRLRPTNASVLKPSTPHTAAAAIGR